MDSQHWLLDPETGTFWQVNDHAAWCLANTNHPLMVRARQGLVALGVVEAERIVRLVARRCSIHFIDLRPGQVVVAFWVRQADLRPFMKAHGLARADVRVILRELKHGLLVCTTGSEFMYGLPLPDAFPVEKYLAKWDQRESKEADDMTVAPHSWSNFCWPGVRPGRVPWAALKSAWRRSAAPSCMNCPGPMIVFQFGLWRATLLNLYPRFRYFCVGCQRCVEDATLWEVPDWLCANLDAETMPTHRRDLWGRLEQWQP